MDLAVVRRSATVPFIIYTLIAVNTALFLLQGTRDNGEPNAYSLDRMRLVPSEVQASVAAWPSLLTSMFAHANWSHLVFNMYALYQFGIPLEKAIGHWHTLGMFLFGGIGANIAYTAVNSSSAVPLVGASAGIASLMAGYFLVFADTRNMVSFLMYQVLGIFVLRQSNISFASHLWGFAFGALYYFLLRNPTSFVP